MSGETKVELLRFDAQQLAALRSVETGKLSPQEMEKGTQPPRKEETAAAFPRGAGMGEAYSQRAADDKEVALLQAKSWGSRLPRRYIRHLQQNPFPETP